MIIFFRNFQDDLDPNNDRAISSADELIGLLEQMRGASPVIAEFCGPGDFDIQIGIGGEFGCVQYSRMDGKPPYLMAVSHRPPMKRGYIEFLCGGTATPVGSILRPTNKTNSRRFLFFKLCMRDRRPANNSSLGLFALRRVSTEPGAGHYEFFDGSAAEKMCASYHFIDISMKLKDVLIRMNAGLTREQGQERSIPLRVTHKSEKNCLAYAAIHGLPPTADDELCGLLKSLAIIEICQISAIV
jgi:hypothetical protein